LHLLSIEIRAKDSCPSWIIVPYPTTKINILYRKFVPYNIQEEKFRNWKNSSLTWIRKRYSNGPTTREHEKEGRAITYQIREMYGGGNSPIKVQLTIFLSGPDWYRLSSSEAWHHLEAYVDLIEKDVSAHSSKGRYSDWHLH